MRSVAAILSACLVAWIISTLAVWVGLSISCQYPVIKSKEQRCPSLADVVVEQLRFASTLRVL